MENASGILQTNIMNDAMNRVPESSEASSHNTALSFVSGPTFTTGSVPSMTLQGSPAAYIPIQVFSVHFFISMQMEPEDEIFICFSTL